MIENIYHCVAIGGLISLVQGQPQPHTRRATIGQDLADRLLYDMTPLLPRVSDETIAIGTEAVNAMAETGTRLARELQIDIDIIVLNLVSFCMDELPCSRVHVRRLRKLIDCYPGVDQYEAIRAGHRVWERMTSECKILRAMAA